MKNTCREPFIPKQAFLNSYLFQMYPFYVSAGSELTRGCAYCKRIGFTADDIRAADNDKRKIKVRCMRNQSVSFTVRQLDLRPRGLISDTGCDNSLPGITESLRHPTGSPRSNECTS